MSKVANGGAGVDANCVFTGPTYNIAGIGADGKAVSHTYDSVGSALAGLNGSVTNINTHVDNRVVEIDKRVTTNEGDITTINTAIKNINSGTAGLVQQKAAGDRGRSERSRSHQQCRGRQGRQDAVNVKQLKDTVTSTSEEIKRSTLEQYTKYLDESKTYTNEAATNNLSASKQYTDQKFDQLSSDIGAVRSEVRQAAGIGLAASSLRYDNTPGKLSVAMGGGAWRGQGAAAFGAGYTSESGKIRANLSGVTSGGKFGVGAGISFTLN
jgi:hypothetical protein